MLSAACISVGSAEPNIPGAESLQATPVAERANCSEIAGTAFRSSAERDWYNENCSRWPLLDAPQVYAPANPNQSPETAKECDRLRGRPYENNDQRSFYMANCTGNQQNASQQQVGADEAQGNSQSNEPDRTSCDEIRGTLYRSNGERDWYQKNCGGNTANGQPAQTQQSTQAQQAQSTAETCARLRARGSGSTSEVAFYRRYCG